MKLGIVGTRGIPAKYGGFETFAQEISIRLAQKGIDVNVYCDKDSYSEKAFKGVYLKYVNTTKDKKPILYYFNSIKAALKENDIILVTGTGGSYFYFLNLFYRKIIVTNTDGVESKRSKWSLLKKWYVKISEVFAVWFSNYLIADSKGIEKYLIESYKNTPIITIIEYGAPINISSDSQAVFDMRLEPNNYLLVVARLEPENNIKMIVEGYMLSEIKMPLVIIGNLNKTDYVSELIQYKSNQILFLGGIYDSEKLNAIRYNAFAYLHGHSVGGTNPSLLEALGSANICICHDNIFNREVTDNKMLYFHSKNSLSELLKTLVSMSTDELAAKKCEAVERVNSYYNWENMTNKYADFLNKI